MRIKSLFWVLCVVCTSIAAAERPTVLMSGHAPKPTPIFIASSAMYAADGTFAPIVPADWRVQQGQIAAMTERLGRHELQASATQTNSTASPCGGVVMAESPLESPVPRESRELAVANAMAIIIGRIKSVTPGFFYGYPGSLIELEDLNKLKLTDAYGSIKGTVYIRLPYAHFTSGGREYCRESDSSKYVPKLGDRVVVFSYAPPADANGTFIYSTSDDIIAQSPNKIYVPKLLSFFGGDNSNVSSIAAAIDAELHSSHRRPRLRGEAQ